MFKAKQLTRTCKATIVGVSLSVALSGCAPVIEQRVGSTDHPGSISGYGAGSIGNPPSGNVVEIIPIEDVLPGEQLNDAAKSGNRRAIRRYLDKGGDINSTDSGGNTPLIIAVLFNKKEIAKMLLQNKADPNVRNSIGDTPLNA